VNVTYSMGALLSAMTVDFHTTLSCNHHGHNHTGAGNMEPPIVTPVRPMAAINQSPGGLVLEGPPQQTKRPSRPMVGKLRTYPELRITQSMFPQEVCEPEVLKIVRARANVQQKALLTIFAIREYFNCGQAVDPNAEYRRTVDHPLWLEKLHDLACWPLLAREYGYDAAIVRQRHRNAIRNGGFWFARWITDHIFIFMDTKTVTDLVWGSYVVMQLSDIMEELQQTTIENDNVIRRNGQKDIEATRLKEMLNLLNELFERTEVSLRTTPGSLVGVKQLLSIAHETDVMCM